MFAKCSTSVHFTPLCYDMYTNKKNEEYFLMELKKISPREFRNNIAKYLLGTDPSAMMRH